MSFFCFANKRAIYLDGKISLANVWCTHLSQVIKSQNKIIYTVVNILNILYSMKIINISKINKYYCYGCSINKTDFPVIKVHVDELQPVRIWQHKLCATLPTSININSLFPIEVYYRICTIIHIRIKIIHGSHAVL